MFGMRKLQLDDGRCHFDTNSTSACWVGGQTDGHIATQILHCACVLHENV